MSLTESVPDDFARALAATENERGVFGARLFYFTETGSTNDLAAAAADRQADAALSAARNRADLITRMHCQVGSALAPYKLGC